MDIFTKLPFNKNFYAALICLPLLAACGSPKDASKANFTKAIDAQLSKRCALASFEMTYASNSTAFPLSIAKIEPGMMLNAEQAKKMDERNFGQYDSAVKAGLLSAVDAQVKPTIGREGPGKTFSLTEVGKKSLIDPRGTAFCAGHYKVDEVVNFTEPGNAMGVTISNVTYTFSPVDVPTWATSDASKAAFPNLAKQLEPKQQGRATLMLQNDGWAAQLSIF